MQPGTTERPGAGAGYDPFDQEFLDDPSRRIQEIHDREPVCHSDLFDSWLITRYDDVVYADDAPVFGSQGDFGPPPPEVLAELERGLPRATTLFESDHPERERLRALVTAAFSAELVATYEPRFRADAEERAAALAPAGRADLVPAYVEPLARAGLLGFIGVPGEDHERVAAWCDQWAALYMPARDLAEQVASAREVVACQHYFAALMAERTAEPRADLITALVQARAADFAPLTEAEIAWQLMELIGAGGNTAYGMANVLAVVLAGPDRAAYLRERPDLLGAAVHEGLRVATPDLGAPRVARERVELDGTVLGAGDPVLLAFAAANHDRSVFPDPGRFDPGRPNADRHVAMGRGARSCVGAALGHMMITQALAALLARCPGLRPDGAGPTMSAPYPFIRCASAIPARWDVDPGV